MTRRNECSALKSAEETLLGWFPCGAAVLAAVSGGVDSMCLLHLIYTWGADHGFSVTAAHFNHGLRGETADRDERFVREYCDKYGIPFLSGSGDTLALAKEEGKSAEEAGRLLRYQFLRSAAKKAGCRWILTAHHADDNAETMLLNLIRGTGSAGLCGIPARRDGICRPFLKVTRAELMEYAAENQIPHVEDETNREDAASRNVIRHRVLPVLRELNPRAVENMTRTAEILLGEDQLLECMEKRVTAQAEQTEHGIRISCGALAELSEPLAGRAAIDLMERACGHRKDLTQRHAAAVTALAAGERDGQISLPYGMTARRAGGMLMIERLDRLPEAVELHRDCPARFGNWIILLRGEEDAGGAAASQDAESLLLDGGILERPLWITCWRPSDFMRLSGARGARSLKRLFADRGIFPARRDGLPVVRLYEEPVAVPGIGADVKFAPVDKKNAARLVFQNENPVNLDTEE